MTRAKVERRKWFVRQSWHSRAWEFSNFFEWSGAAAFGIGEEFLAPGVAARLWSGRAELWSGPEVWEILSTARPEGVFDPVTQDDYYRNGWLGFLME